MTTKSTCKRLTIFEGPDGSGKTTAAQAYAKMTNAVYVHFGPLLEVDKGLPRLYIEAMLPALLGHQDVVFDRCWLSEVPYGTAFRGGRDRIGEPYRRMLERVAMRCEASVVRCLPDWEVVRSNYCSRKEIEYLENETQLWLVYDLYRQMETSLPMTTFDYTVRAKMGCVFDEDQRPKTKAHDLGVRSAGNMDASVIIVGEKFAEPKEYDPWYQCPFVSFSGLGCSRWLTELLNGAGISENRLLWVNADELKGPWLIDAVEHDASIFALGRAAEARLNEMGVYHTAVEHPQSWKRFHDNKPYPLITLLKECLS